MWLKCLHLVLKNVDIICATFFPEFVCSVACFLEIYSVNQSSMTVLQRIGKEGGG